MQLSNLNSLKIKLQLKKECGQNLTEEEEGILSDLLELLGPTKKLNESLARAGKVCKTCGRPF